MKKMMTTAALLALLAAPCATYVLGAGDGEKGVPKERILGTLLQSDGQAQKQDQAQVQAQQQVQAQKQDQRQAQQQKQDQAQVQAQKQDQRQAQQQVQAQKQDQRQAQQQVQAQKQDQAQVQAQTPVQKPRKNRKYGPDWQVGDYWIVESTNRQTQSGAQRQAQAVRWRFEVVGMARIQGRDCYQAKITAIDVAAGSPVAHIWVDSETGALVRVATLTLVRGEWVKRVQTFQGANGKSTGVFGSIPCLPIDMPLFSEDGSKALAGEEEIYAAVDGDDDGSKALNDAAPNFAYKVKTSTQALTEDGAKALLDGSKGLLDGAKGLDDAIEVTMDGGSRKARQIWTPNSPWPVYSANDTCEARLVETNVGE